MLKVSAYLKHTSKTPFDSWNRISSLPIITVRRKGIAHLLLGYQNSL